MLLRRPRQRIRAAMTKQFFTFWDMLIVFIAGMPIGIAASHYGWIPGL